MRIQLYALVAMSLECILFVMFSFAVESFLRYLEKFCGLVL